VTERKFYIGSMGPYLFDDADPIDDQDGDFSGENYKGIRTDSSLKAQELEGIVISSLAVADIDDPSSELSTLSASLVGGMIFVYEAIAGAADPFTMYLWDTNITSTDIPYVVAGSGGYWVAVGGRYLHSDLSVRGDVLVSGTLSLLNLTARSEPDEPDEGKAVVWLSNGTGKGHAGDIVAAAKVSGIPRHKVLFNYDEANFYRSSSGLDALLSIVVTQSAGIDALLNKEGTISASLDAIIDLEGTATTGMDAVLYIP